MGNTKWLDDEYDRSLTRQLGAAEHEAKPIADQIELAAARYVLDSAGAPSTDCDFCGRPIKGSRYDIGGKGGWTVCTPCAGLGECDCCGKFAPLSRGFAAGGIETFACEECAQ